jgi:hypothetical protein
MTKLQAPPVPAGGRRTIAAIAVFVFMLNYFAIENDLYAQTAGISIGPRVDLVGGGATTQSFGNSTSPAASQNLNSYYYRVFPSLTMTAKGQRSTMQASYAFGYNRDKTLAGASNDSHVATLTLSAPVGRDWKINITDSFARTSNLAAFNASRGVTSPVPTTFNFLFYPSGVNQTSQNSSTQIGAEYRLTATATLAMNASYARLNYLNGGGFGGALTNQQRTSVGASYRQQTNERGSWSVDYTMAYLTFTAFESTQSQSVTAGYSYRFGNDMQFQVKAGPSYANNPQSGRSYASYNASASLQKILKTNTISLYASQTSGDATGLGGVSDSRTAGFSFNHRLAQNMTVSADTSAFDSQAKLGNSFSTRGGSAALTVGVSFTKTISLNWGGQYQRYQQLAPFGYEQKRLFISLRYNDPELWRSSR